MGAATEPLVLISFQKLSFCQGKYSYDIPDKCQMNFYFKEKQIEDKYTLYVNNLPRGETTEELQELFTGAREILKPKKAR